MREQKRKRTRIEYEVSRWLSGCGVGAGWYLNRDRWRERATKRGGGALRWRDCMRRGVWNTAGDRSVISVSGQTADMRIKSC